MTFDLIIRGGTVVQPDGVVQADVAVRDGVIAATGEPGSLDNADRVIDAHGLHVFPGIIDPHVHLQTFRDPFDVNVRTESRNAAIGGVTTMIPMLETDDGSGSFLEYGPWAREAVESGSVIDVAFSAVVGTDQQIDELRADGHEIWESRSYKFYMAYTQDEASVFGIIAMDDEQISTGPADHQAIGSPAMSDGARREHVDHPRPQGEVHRRGPQRPQGVDRRAARHRRGGGHPPRDLVHQETGRGSTSCT